jgi:hypothetical protein
VKKYMRSIWGGYLEPILIEMLCIRLRASHPVPAHQAKPASPYCLPL